MIDTLTVEYEEFEELSNTENVVLTISRGDEAINMFYSNDAKRIYELLKGIRVSYEII